MHAVMTSADAFDRWCSLVEDALESPDDERRWATVLSQPAPPVDLGLDPDERAVRLERVLALSNEVQLRRMNLLTELVSVTEERRALATRGRALAHYLTAGGRSAGADSPQA